MRSILLLVYPLLGRFSEEQALISSLLEAQNNLKRSMEDKNRRRGGPCRYSDAADAYTEGCFRERIDKFNLVFPLHVSNAQTFRQWWADAFELDQHVAAAEREVDEFGSVVFGLGGDANHPFGNNGLQRTSKVSEEAANAVVPISDTFKNKVNDRVARLNKATYTDFGGVTTKTTAALTSLAAGVQDAFGREFKQQLVNQDLFVKRSNERLVLANSFTNNASMYTNDQASLLTERIADTDQKLVTQAGELAEAFNDMNQTFATFNPELQQVLTTAVAEPFAESLAEKILPDFETQTQAALERLAARFENVREVYLSSTDLAIQTESSNWTTQSQTRLNESLLLVQEASNELSISLSQAETQLQALVDALYIEIRSFEAKTQLTRDLDASTTEKLKTDVKRLTEASATWGFGVSPRVSSLREAVEQKRRGILQEVAAGTFDAQAGFAQAMLGAIADVAKAKKAMLEDARAAQARMDGILAEMAAQLGLSGNQLSAMVMNLQSSVDQLRASLGKSSGSGSMKVSGKLAASLEDALMGEANKAVMLTVNATRETAESLRSGLDAAKAVEASTKAAVLEAQLAHSEAASDLAYISSNIQTSSALASSNLTVQQDSQRTQVASVLAQMAVMKLQVEREERDASEALGEAGDGVDGSAEDILGGISRMTEFSVQAIQKAQEAADEATRGRLRLLASEAETKLTATVNALDADVASPTRVKLEETLNELAKQSKYGINSADNMAKLVDEYLNSLAGNYDDFLGHLTRGEAAMDAELTREAAKVTDAEIPTRRTKLEAEQDSMIASMKSQVEDLVVAGEASGSEFHDTFVTEQSRLKNDAHAVRSVAAAVEKFVTETDEVVKASKTEVENLRNANFSQTTRSSISDFESGVSQTLKSNIDELRQVTAPLVESAAQRIGELLESSTFVPTLDAGPSAEGEVGEGASETIGRVVDAIKRLAAGVGNFEREISDQVVETTANETNEFTYFVNRPLIGIFRSLANLIDETSSNTTGVEHLLGGVAEASDATLTETWRTLQQAETLAESQAKQMSAEAEFETTSAARQTALSVAQLREDVASSALVVGSLKETLEHAKAAEEAEMETLATQLTRNRAEMAGMMGRALEEISEVQANTTKEVETERSTTAVDGALMKIAIGNIIEAWSAAQTRNVEEAKDVTRRTQEEVVEGGKTAVRQAVGSLKREIITAVKEAVQEDVTKLSSMSSSLVSAREALGGRTTEAVKKLTSDVRRKLEEVATEVQMNMEEVLVRARNETETEMQDARTSLINLVISTAVKLQNLEPYIPHAL